MGSGPPSVDASGAAAPHPDGSYDDNSVEHLTCRVVHYSVSHQRLALTASISL